MIFFRNSIQNDRFCDVIPIVSTISNVQILYRKIIDFPKLSQLDIQSNHYYNHIDCKSFYRCVILLIPIVGNLCVFVCDLVYFCCFPRTINPAIDLDVSEEFQIVNSVIYSEITKEIYEEKEDSVGNGERNQLYLIQLSNELNELSFVYRNLLSFDSWIREFVKNLS